MEYAYRLFKNVQFFYNTLNPATLSGAIDVIVVEQPDGTLVSTPFHVRFGKYGVFTSNEKYVDVTVNGEEIDLKMKLGENGVAFFVEETEDADVPEYLVTSPLPSEGRDIDITKVIEQSVRALEERQKRYNSRSANKRVDSGSTSIVSSLFSRSPSPSSGRSFDEQKKLKEMKSKKSLPFNASLFSQRRYRSLPNLSELVEASNLDTTDNLESNMENDVPLIVDDTNKDQFKLKQQQVKKDGRRRLTHSRSTVDNRSLTPPPHTTRRKKQLLDRERRDRNAKLSTKKAKQNKLNKDQGNKDELEDTLSSTSSLSSGTSNPSAENDGYIMFSPKGEFGRQQSQQSQANIQSPKMHDLDNIADGAVSDSEVDRHRNAPQPHGSDVTEWKWGEIPKTRDDEKAEKELRASAAQKATEKTKKEETSWSDWFRWSKPKLTEDQGIYLDDLVENSLHDPSKIEKYLGKSSSACPSPPYDSGNASSTASCGPNSPQSLSVDTDEPATAREPSKEASTAREDKTPTEEHPPENVHPSKDLTDIVGQHQPRPVSSSENRQEETMKKLDNGRKRRQSGRSTSPSSDIFAMSDEETNIPGTSSPPHTEDVTQQQSPTYIRSLRLPSEKLKKLPLKKGANEARFSITTKFQGTCWCSCHIYLYRWSEQLVISDIDGTITKSDVLGHVIPAIGGQWAHAGVAELYTRIAHNGYKMVYLSSRAIGQSYYTKKYLQSIAQDTRVLPDGPLLLSPTSVLMAFRREVIDRCPEDFKIAALSDLKECFPVEQPFYAGFGNRPNDVIAYRHVGVRPDRILIINKEGRVRREDGIGFETSYMSMALDIVDYMFPPLVTQPKHLNLAVEADNVGRKIYRLKQSFPEALKFSEFTHWRSEPQKVLSTEMDYSKYEEKRKQYTERKKTGSVTKK